MRTLIAAAVVASLAAFALSIQPSGDQREAPDGTMLPVLSKSEHTLVIEDLKLGDGPECSRSSEITFHYHGALADGKVFESTRGKQPETYPVNRLIPGWQAGVAGMKAGGVRRLVIPPVMAYGAKDRMNNETGQVQIPANSTLTFTIHIVAVKPALTSGRAAINPDVLAQQPAGQVKIEDLVVGTGRECPKGATVTVNYRGTFLDGTEFSSSYQGNEPLQCSLVPGGTSDATGVIPGWQEGIPGMKVGGKRKLTIPPDMAYGAAGRPGIPPNSTLVFEIELIDVR